MNYSGKEYKKKVISAGDIPGIIKPGMTVYLEQGPSEPTGIVNAMMSQVEALSGIKLVILPFAGVNKVPFAAQQYTDHWQIYSFIGCQFLSKAMAEKRVEYVPIHLSDVPPALNGAYRPDVAVIQVSPPDSAGFCSLGPAVDFNRAAIDAATTVIAQVNCYTPMTCGDSGVHLSEIDYIFEEDTELIQVPPTEFGAIEQQIAGYAAELIPNGATFQIGIGGVPDAIIAALADKRDLGIHSGMLSDRMMALIQSGVVTGSKKNINTRKVVAGAVLGTNQLYKFCDRNTSIEIHPTTHTHNINIASKLDNFVSINSAIEVDLFGQISVEVVNGKQVSGVGGLVDYLRLARLAPGGKSIVALTSATKGKSKIVPHFKQGTPVSGARTDVDYIVTEFGVAELRYRSARERARALIQIAHPDSREELRYWAEQI